jgi:H+-translocating NAD(P) transhydrogenase
MRAQMVSAMKQGSVIVDLAAETGGNCEVTKPGETYSYKGVTIIGYTDLPSRLPTQSSTLYSNNITKFLLSIGGNGQFSVNLEDEVVRGSIVLHNGTRLPPAPRPVPPAPVVPPPTTAKEAEVTAITPWQKAKREVATITAGMGSTIALGKLAGPAFMSNFFTFGLAGLIGYRVVWGVAPALHSPLMSVTNAISGECSDVCAEFKAKCFGQAWSESVDCTLWVVVISQKQFHRSSVPSPYSSQV